MRSTIRLFNAVPVTRNGKKKLSKELLAKTIKYGFIFSPEVIFNYHENDLVNLIKEVSNELSLSAKQMNNSFHKSWEKVKNADIEQLVLEQILHYITTYGFEEVGIYDKDSVYIPLETLEIPKLKLDKINLIVIKGYTKAELKDKLITLLGTGIALSEDTKNDVIDVATFVEFTEAEIHNIKNKEVKICLYDFLDVIPEDPVEFLRYMIYKSTGKTLIIKNSFTIDEIKSHDNLPVLGLLTKYEKKYGLSKLAEIFLRFKPLFLAFKTKSSKMNSVINKIRKLADKHHKPMKEDYLNEVTAKIRKGFSISGKQLTEELSKVNTFRKIRLAYALKFRAGDPDSILYRIRNGKSYATEFVLDDPKGIAVRATERALDTVLTSITKDISANVKDKKIYIPKDIHYTLPATEKQFTGNFPSGTYVAIPKDMIVGVHWTNVNGERIDLDLSLINCTEGKIGWDGLYRTEDRNVLFSGDVTDAPEPDGASEFFYVQKQCKSSTIVMLNYYNSFGEDIEVPFKIITGSELVKNFRQNYMINPNNVILVVKSKITGGSKQKMLGLITTTPEESRFYFVETSIGNSITSYGGGFTERARKYMFDFYQNTISLNELLEEAGARIVSDKDKCDIDLSPEALEKDTILNLVS